MNVIKDKYYFPNNSLLTVAGDVTNADAIKQAKAIFGDWKASDFDAFKKWPIPPFKPLNPADSLSFVVINENARVPIMQIGWHGPDTRTDLKNTLVADVFSDIVSQKNSSFQKNLVDSGYALNAGISYFTQAYVGPITIFFVPNPGKFKLAFRALQKEIDRFDAEDYFTDDQLETAKIKKANEEIYSREVTSNLVHSLSFWWSSASLDYYFSYVSEIQKITRKDIQDYVRKYIKRQPCVKGLLLNPGMQKNWNVTDLDALFK
jgi:zinc protease